MKKSLLLLLGFLLLLAMLGNGIGAVQRQMNQIRTDAKLTTTTPVENAPPIIAFTTVALGGFRGLLADILWLRSEKMKQEGNYFELVQLADWIVKLQPRFTGATAFLAWNMAYNVSVTFSSHEDRWRWVQAGIELLRDEGLVYNPGDPKLYSELAWIYRHKLGADLDDANRYYKIKLAEQMIEVTGQYPPDWQRWAQMPAKLKDATAFLELQPDTLPALFTKHALSLRKLDEIIRETGTLPEPLQAELPPQLAADLEIFLRKRWLLQVYKLDPAYIKALNDEYGELDWRLPEAHAVYWGRKGLDTADQGVNMDCERMVFQALNLAFKKGRLLYAKDVQTFEATPNINLADAVEKIYLLVMQQHPENIGVRAGYENWLTDAVVILYTFNAIDKAGQYLKTLRREFANPQRYNKPLDEFVLHQLAGDVATASSYQARTIVQAYLFQSFQALVFEDIERAAAFERIARKIRNIYMADLDDTRIQERKGMPPYPQMQRQMIQLCMERFPPAFASRLRRALEAQGVDLAFLAEMAPPASTTSPAAPNQ